MQLSVTAAAILALSSLAASTGAVAQALPAPSRSGDCRADADASIVSRIGPPAPKIAAIFAGTGASDINTHDLSAPELALVAQALARLPHLHRYILHRHLRRLSFLELQPGTGSALTRLVDPGAATPQFDISLRSSLLGETLTSFLNTKERRLFRDDGSGFQVSFDAGSSDALTYILLHEATHVVNQVRGLSDDQSSPVGAGIWSDLRTLADPHASSLAAQTLFRGRSPIPLRHAPVYYASLQASPFVSFYATAAAPEDVAELFAWQQLAATLTLPLTLTVVDRHGSPVFHYEPLATPTLQSRFAVVADMLMQYETACAIAAQEQP